MENPKFDHKLVKDLNENYVAKIYTDELNTALTNILNIRHSNAPHSGVEFRRQQTSNWATPENIDFYSTYAFDATHDEIRPSYQSFDSPKDEDKVFLAVGNDAYMGLYLDTNLDAYFHSHNRYKTSAKLTMFGKTLKFDIDQNIQDVHKAAMIYCYAMEQLNKMSVKEAYGSRFHNIKLTLENYFSLIANNEKTNLDLDSLLSKEEMDICVSSAKAETLKRFLINKDIIPQENGKMKYPTSYEKLVEFVPTVAEKYQQVKDRVKAKQDKAKQRELIKNKKRELKLAKIEEKRQLKEKQEQKRKSVRETDFNITL